MILLHGNFELTSQGNQYHRVNFGKYEFEKKETDKYNFHYFEGYKANNVS